MNRRLLALLGSVALIGVALAVAFGRGCSSQPPPNAIVTEKGKLLVGGQPLGGVKVEFWPLTNRDKFDTLPYGQTKPDGTFTVGVSPLTPGLPPGKYKVTAIVIDKKNKDKLPAKYTDFGSTPW